MRVAVTGGRGFIGRRVVAELEERGSQAVPVDRSDGRPVEWINRFDDVATCDAVVHLAGVLGTAELFDSPFEAVDTNVKGTLHVLEACRAWDMGFVGITMPPVWANVYTATKVCATTLASAWHRHRGVPVSHVRAFNAYGPDQAVGPGHPQKILPTFASHAWRGEPLPVWGDGSQTVDLVHVDDVARMLVEALDFGNDEVFDAGTGKAVTVLEVAEFVIEVAGGGRVEHLPMRPGEHPVEIVARGEGWDWLNWHPELDWDRVAEAVRSYRP